LYSAFPRAAAFSFSLASFNGRSAFRFLLQTICSFCAIVFCAQNAFATTPPTISPGYTVFSAASQSVTITASAGTINYTTDGSTPTTGSPTYSSPFNVTSSTTVKAIATVSGVSSTVTTAYIQKDTTTANVPRSGMLVWLKADNGVITSSGNVTNWVNVANNANSAAQATSTAQPTLTASAINGQPAVSFNGTSQFMQLSSSITGLTTAGAVYIVTKPTAVTAGARFFDFGNGSTSNNIYMSEPTNTGVSLYSYNGSSGSSITSSSGVTLNTAQLLEATLTFLSGSTSTAALYTNSVQGATGVANATSTARTSNFIGTDFANSLFFQGQIAEIIVYDVGLAASTRYSIEGYLYAKYGITVNPPLISKTTGVYTVSQGVTLTGDPGASLFYTLDGSTPSSLSTPYTGTITINTSKTLKAIAIQSFGTSPVATSYIQIDPNSANVSRSTMLLWLKADNGVVTSSSNVTQPSVPMMIETL
jgi:hypothetical protein